MRQTADENLLTLEFINQTKNQLLALKMPTKYKDLHLDLILAMTKMEDYLEDGDEGKKAESEELIQQAKTEYEWLN